MSIKDPTVQAGLNLLQLRELFDRVTLTKRQVKRGEIFETDVGIDGTLGVKDYASLTLFQRKIREEAAQQVSILQEGLGIKAPAVVPFEEPSA